MLRILISSIFRLGKGQKAGEKTFKRRLINNDALHAKEDSVLVFQDGILNMMLYCGPHSSHWSFTLQHSWGYT